MFIRSFTVFQYGFQCTVSTSFVVVGISFSQKRTLCIHVKTSLFKSVKVSCVGDNICVYDVWYFGVKKNLYHTWLAKKLSSYIPLVRGIRHLIILQMARTLHNLSTYSCLLNLTCSSHIKVVVTQTGHFPLTIAVSKEIGLLSKSAAMFRAGPD